MRIPTATPTDTALTATEPQTTAPTSTPTPTSVRLVAISSGQNHTCALREDGIAVCWGLDTFGQASPPEGERFVTVDSGAAHSCGLSADGSVTCWGAEKLVDAYPEHERFVSIDIGFVLSCGIHEDGATVCWTDIYGVPETLETRYSTVSSGLFLRCGLLEDGRSMCQDLGLFGGGVVSPPVEDDGRFASISTGLFHVCALRDDGTPVCWGSDESSLVSPPQGEVFSAISSGGEHTCALRDDGTPVCWGSDESGQASPPQGEAFTAISSGGEHTCALRADGTAVCWGNDYYGQSVPIIEAGPNPEPDYPAGELLWRFSFPSNKDMSSDPTVADGVVYITLYDNSLHAIDASTGSAIWSHQADGWITSSPVVVDGMAYAGSWDRYVYALDAATGELLWRYLTNDEAYYPLTVIDGVVYAGSGGYVYALQASTGYLLWSSEIDVHVSFSPILAGTVVYIGSLTGYLYALDASTGEVLWRHKANEESYSVSASGGKVYNQVFSAPAVVDEAVYIGTDSGHVRALDASTGDLLWEYETPTDVILTPVVDEGVVYATGSFDGFLYALNASTGEPIWVYKEGDRIGSLAVGGGTIYTLAHGILVDNVHALDSSTGEFRWRVTGYEALGPFLSDGAVYASTIGQSEDGPVIGVGAFDAETGEVLWGYHANISLGRPATVADGVVYATPTENYHDPEHGYTGWYLYALAAPRTK